MRLLLPLLAAATLWADSYPRQPGIDVQHYIFRVTLSDDTDEIEGETTVTIKWGQPELRDFFLDLGPAMKVTEVRGYTYRHEGEKLQISLDFAPKIGEKRDFLIKYRGKPAAGLKILTNKYQERGFFSAN